MTPVSSYSSPFTQALLSAQDHQLILGNLDKLRFLEPGKKLYFDQEGRIVDEDNGSWRAARGFIGAWTYGFLAPDPVYTDIRNLEFFADHTIKKIDLLVKERGSVPMVTTLEAAMIGLHTLKEAYQMDDKSNQLNIVVTTALKLKTAFIRISYETSVKTEVPLLGWQRFLKKMINLMQMDANATPQMHTLKLSSFLEVFKEEIEKDKNKGELLENIFTFLEKSRSYRKELRIECLASMIFNALTDKSEDYENRLKQTLESLATAQSLRGNIEVKMVKEMKLFNATLLA